jgi:hypothetical protein
VLHRIMRGIEVTSTENGATALVKVSGSACVATDLNVIQFRHYANSGLVFSRPFAFDASFPELNTNSTPSNIRNIALSAVLRIYLAIIVKKQGVAPGNVAESWQEWESFSAWPTSQAEAA